MTGNYKYRALWLLCSLLITACSKDGADGNDVSNPNEEAKEIGIMVNVSKMAEATRTTTYDGVSALQAEEHFTCMAYEAGTLTAYIPPSTTVDWNSTQWVFNNGGSHYYWPLPSTPGGTYPSLDFFGYMPATPPAYITVGPTYTAGHNVTFTCSGLPMTSAGQQDDDLKEFVFGMALDKSYSNASGGVTLQFQHPFARIKLQLAASHPDITINSITFKSIKNNGSYNHNATPKWTPFGAAADFVLTLTGDAAVFDNNPASPPTQIGDYYIMIPQEWAGEIVVNATWTDWGAQLAHTVSTTLPSSVTWQSGCNYTYTFTITETDLKVNSEKFTEQW